MISAHPGASTPLTIMLVAGEPSGDQLGAQLMVGLEIVAAQMGRPLRIIGVGGSAMEAKGLKSLFPLDVTAVMGLREVVPRIPAILKRVRIAADYAKAEKPDAVVFIDSPDFTHRIAKRLKRIAPDIGTINYVAPQVWASREYRAKAMASYFDLVLALLPFEVPFFERHGLAAVFTGHPVIERVVRMTGGAEFRRKYNIAPGAPLLAVLPGSRRNEIRFILPVFKETVAKAAQHVPGLICVLPTVSHVADTVRAETKDWPVPLVIVESEAEKFAAFDAADAALAASGTVTTELALSNTPMVVGYKVGWLTYALAKPLMRVTYITLVNLILGRAAIPEFLQDRCTARDMAPTLIALLSDEKARAAQNAALSEAAAALGQGEEPPSIRAARAILGMAARDEAMHA
jgi:lipid-A-disaccharide synthase